MAKYSPTKLRTASIPAHKLLVKGVTPKQEVKKLRTPTSKTFKLKDGYFRQILGMKVVHFERDNRWEEVDVSLVKQGDAWKSQNTEYDIKILENEIGFTITIDGSTARIFIDPKENKHLDIKSAEIVVQENQIFWKFPKQEIEIKVLLSATTVSFYKLLTGPEAPKNVSWSVESTKHGRVNFVEKVCGRDNEGNRTKHQVSKRNKVEDDENVSYILDEKWTGEVAKVVDKTSRKKDWSKDAIYPILIDPSTSIDISNGVDDVHEGRTFIWDSTNTEWDLISSSLNTNGTKIYGGFYGLGSYISSYHPGFRFRSVGIAQGATITSADLELYVLSRNNTPKFKIYGNDADNAALWTATNERPTQMTKTSASATTTINVSSTAINPGITSIVQEIVNRAGWSSNNAMKFGLIVQDTPASTSSTAEQAQFEALEHAGSNEAVLSVTYSTGTAVNSSRNSVITGYSGTDINSSRSSVITGNAATTSDRDSVIVGNDTSQDNRSASITGNESVNSERDSHIIGNAIANDNRDATMLGVVKDDRSASIHGYEALSDSRDAVLSGSDVSISERFASIAGILTVGLTDSISVSDNLDIDTRHHESYEDSVIVTESLEIETLRGLELNGVAIPKPHSWTTRILEDGVFHEAIDGTKIWDVTSTVNIYELSYEIADFDDSSWNDILNLYEDHITDGVTTVYAIFDEAGLDGYCLLDMSPVNYIKGAGDMGKLRLVLTEEV